MADIFIELELDTSAADDVFSRLIAKSVDLSPLMAQYAGLLHAITGRAFDGETAPDGIPWPELAESTQKAKVYSGARRGSAHMLRVTDALFESMQATSGPDFAQIAATLPELYPSYLMTGTSRMPARPYVGLEPDSAATIAELAEQFLASGV